MITAGSHRVRKLDRYNWAIEKVSIATEGKRAGEEVSAPRGYTGKLTKALDTLMNLELLEPDDKEKEAVSLKIRLEEVRSEILAGVESFEARLKKVEAGLNNPETIKDMLDVKFEGGEGE